MQEDPISSPIPPTEVIPPASAAPADEGEQRVSSWRVAVFVCLFTVLYFLSPPFVVKVFALFGSGGEDSACEHLTQAIYGPVRLLYDSVPPYRAVIDWEFKLLRIAPE